MGVWHADQLGAAPIQAVPTGHAALDAALPGGGWPAGALAEVLQPRAAGGSAMVAPAWALIGAGVAAMARRRAGAVLFVGAPHEPFAPALQACGIAAARLCRVQAATAAERLWVAEQALRCHDVAAVLAWLPQARPEQLRRLQLAAQRHGALLFAFRPASVRHDTTPAVLRLLVESTVPGALATQLRVHVLKRRGPPLDDALLLHATQGERLDAVLAAQAAWRRQHAVPAVAAPTLPATRPSRHDPVAVALDRAALAAG